MTNTTNTKPILNGNGRKIGFYAPGTINIDPDNFVPFNKYFKMPTAFYGYYNNNDRFINLLNRFLIAIPYDSLDGKSGYTKFFAESKENNPAVPLTRRQSQNFDLNGTQETDRANVHLSQFFWVVTAGWTLGQSMNNPLYVEQ